MLADRVAPNLLSSSLSPLPRENRIVGLVLNTESTLAYGKSIAVHQDTTHRQIQRSMPYVVVDTRHLSTGSAFRGDTRLEDWPSQQDPMLHAVNTASSSLIVRSKCLRNVLGTLSLLRLFTTDDEARSLGLRDFCPNEVPKRLKISAFKKNTEILPRNGTQHAMSP